MQGRATRYARAACPLCFGLVDAGAPPATKARELRAPRLRALARSCARQPLREGGPARHSPGSPFGFPLACMLRQWHGATRPPASNALGFFDPKQPPAVAAHGAARQGWQAGGGHASACPARAVSASAHCGRFLFDAGSGARRHAMDTPPSVWAGAAGPRAEVFAFDSWHCTSLVDHVRGF